MKKYYIILICTVFLIENILCLDQEIYWGTYKPHLIFALTEKTLNPITSGFFYYNRKDSDNQNSFLSNNRFKYHSDFMIRYLEHNGIDYAFEQMEDPANKMILDIKFLKEKFSTFTNQSWRVSFNSMFKYSEDPEEEDFQSNNNKIAFVFYTSVKNFFLKDKKNLIRLKEYEKDKFALLEFISKNITDLNETSRGFIRIESYEDKCLDTKSLITLLKVEDEKIWDVDYLYFQKVLKSEKYEIFEKNREGSEKAQAYDENSHNESNIFYMTFFLQKNCRYVISYDSEKVPTPYEEKYFEELEKKKQNDFYQVFISRFMNEKDNFREEDSLRRLRLSMYSFSNLIGGISHYYGKFLEVNNIYEHSFKEVFTCTPSRGKFPRGFLWDEGFHLLIICKYNEDLCIKLLDNWLSLMDVDGWIAREQIRNEETAFGLEERFLKQDNYEGNPPTLLFPILYLMRIHKNINNEENAYKLKDFLHKCFNKLKLWFFWFLENQNDSDKYDYFHEAYLFSEQINFRWHCKGDCHDGNFLGSGLDDFPRQTPGTLSISHLDMHTWLMFFSESLTKIAKFLNLNEEIMEYQNIYQDLYDKLYEEFKDPSDNIFKDVISLEKYDNDNDKFSFNNNVGYINIFPLIFGFIQDPDILKQYYKILLDYNQLWSDYGIRSLSKSSRFFGSGDNYWRGPIWIPINFLILRSLKVYYGNMPEAVNIYNRLRDNLMKNLLRNFEMTGHIWENYDSITGRGQREKGFCGWSALITLILKEEYF